MIPLKIKNIPIRTGKPIIALLNIKDAEKYDFNSGDRIRISNGRKKIIALLDLVEGNTLVKPGYIGLMKEASQLLNLKNNSVVKIKFEQRPKSVNYIKEKLDGLELNKTKIEAIVQDIVDNKLSEIEMTYFVAACFNNSMNLKEVTMLTKAMVNTGDVLKINKKIVLDKHCIGGVAGNRTSMLLVPIISSLGLTIPKTSSRSITSAAGTADTMEVLCDVCLDINRMKKVINKANGCLVWGGALNLAPADDKIIFVERPMNLDSDSQLIASILAKKLSVGATHIIIDIPVGKGAKVENIKKAESLKRQFISIAEKLGKKIKIIITDGSQPIGNGIGPALEARDVLWILKRHPNAPKDLENKAIMMAEEMLKMVGINNARKLVLDTLNSGKAYEKMKQIVELQGKKVIDPDEIKLAKLKLNVYAEKNGRITHLDNSVLCKIARIAGAPQCKSAGIYLYKHLNDSVKKGELIYTIYSESKEKLNYCSLILKEMNSYTIN